MLLIKQFREQMKCTQAELAKILGVTQSAVAMWENGERKPGIIMLKKLAGVFGCSTDALLEPIDTKEENLT